MSFRLRTSSKPKCLNFILWCMKELYPNENWQYDVFFFHCIWNEMKKHVPKVVYDLGVSKQFGPKKSYKKNWQSSQKVLNYTKSSNIIFCPKLFWYFQYIYYLQKELTHFGLQVSKHFVFKNSTKQIDMLYSLFYSFSTINYSPYKFHRFFLSGIFKAKMHF